MDGIMNRKKTYKDPTIYWNVSRLYSILDIHVCLVLKPNTPISIILLISASIILSLTYDTSISRIDKLRVK